MRDESRSNIATDHAMTHVGNRALGPQIVVTNADLPPETQTPDPSSQPTDLDVGGAGSLSHLIWLQERLVLMRVKTVRLEPR